MVINVKIGIAVRFCISMVFFIIFSTIIYSQEKPFSLKINTGYIYYLDNKYTRHSNIIGLGSYNSGQIPIEIELQYKILNLSLGTDTYKRKIKNLSNLFWDNLYLNFAYGYDYSIPYKYIIQSNHFVHKQIFNLPTHTLRMGLLYDISEYLYSPSQFYIYVGINMEVLLSRSREHIIEIVDGKITKNQLIFSNYFLNYGVMPQLNAEYYFPTLFFSRNRFSQFFRKKGFHLIFSIAYTAIFPTPLTNNIHQITPQTSQAINGRLGIGLNL